MFNFPKKQNDLLISVFYPKTLQIILLQTVTSPDYNGSGQKRQKNMNITVPPNVISCAKYMHKFTR